MEENCRVILNALEYAKVHGDSSKQAFNLQKETVECLLKRGYDVIARNNKDDAEREEFRYTISWIRRADNDGGKLLLDVGGVVEPMSINWLFDRVYTYMHPAQLKHEYVLCAYSKLANFRENDEAVREYTAERCEDGFIINTGGDLILQHDEEDPSTGLYINGVKIHHYKIVARR